MQENQSIYVIPVLCRDENHVFELVQLFGDISFSVKIWTR